MSKYTLQGMSNDESVSACNGCIRDLVVAFSVGVKRIAVGL